MAFLRNPDRQTVGILVHYGCGKRVTALVNRDQAIYEEISALIEQSRRVVYAHVNSATVLLFWRIGQRINREILMNKRADYGKHIVVTLSRQLAGKYGRSFEEKNLRRMLQFADQFSDEEIVVSLSRQLSWSHFLALIPLKSDEAKRNRRRTAHSNVTDSHGRVQGPVPFRHPRLERRIS
jgi:hypothetical protein